ncbi:MAG: ABC transporter permease [Ilumatobacter sp.]|nr:MAG: ABC transporter permease [Ilumatobacter sp.]
MLRAALRDLQWRRRRFAIAMTGVALVFALGLVMTGLAASFSAEVDRTLDGVGADAWGVSAQTSGPFTSFTPVPMESGGPGATPAMTLRQTIATDEVLDIIVLGVTTGSLGTPEVTTGRTLAGPGEMVADSSLEGVALGDVISFGGGSFEVVGTTDGQRMFAGLPVVHIDLTDAQAISVQGAPVANAFLYETRPDAIPDSLRIMSPAEVRDDTLRPLDGALASIQLVRLLLWLVAATIIGSVLYLQTIERTRDFAVFKATGTSTGAIAAGLSLQAIVLSIAAAILAALLGALLAPVFPMYVEIPISAFVLLPVVTVGVGLLSSLLALRRTVSVQPALAFGG